MLQKQNEKRKQHVMGELIEAGEEGLGLEAAAAVIVKAESSAQFNSRRHQLDERKAGQKKWAKVFDTSHEAWKSSRSLCGYF